MALTIHQIRPDLMAGVLKVAKGATKPMGASSLSCGRSKNARVVRAAPVRPLEHENGFYHKSDTVAKNVNNTATKKIIAQETSPAPPRTTP